MATARKAGIEATRRIRETSPGVRVLGLSVHRDGVLHSVGELVRFAARNGLVD